MRILSSVMSDSPHNPLHSTGPAEQNQNRPSHSDSPVQECANWSGINMRDFCQSTTKFIFDDGMPMHTPTANMLEHAHTVVYKVTLNFPGVLNW